MRGLKIALLLHFYQPWWQFPWVIDSIVNQCYRPILSFIKDIDGFCFTANINVSLLDHLGNGYPDVIAGFQDAVSAGKIELVSSPAQHPIMPLISDKIQKAQIEDDRLVKMTNYGLLANSGGFYLPEMAFSARNIPLLRNEGFAWTVADDLPFGVRFNYVPSDHVIVSDGFKVFLRSREWSIRVACHHLPFSEIKAKMEYELPGWTGGGPAYIVIGMDAETFGHHPGDSLENFLKPALSEWVGDKIVSFEKMSEIFPARRVDNLPDGSWSTSAEDVHKNDPYPLWKSHRFNDYHDLLWRLTEIALGHFDEAREDCLKITSSCHWWWISRDYWKPQFMKLGAEKAMGIIRKHGSADEIHAATRFYNELMALRNVD